MINKFLIDESDYFENDFHFQDNPFRVAARIHHKYILKGNTANFVSWLRENEIFHTPREAVEYFRRNYYE